MDKRIQELQQRVVSLEKQQQSYWDSMTVIDERQKNQEKRLTALEKHAELKDKQCNGLQDKVAKLEEAVQMVKKCTCDKEPCICFSKPTCKTCKDTKLVPAWADYMKSVPCPACAKKCICNTTPCSCVPNLKCDAPKTSCSQCGGSGGVHKNCTICGSPKTSCAHEWNPQGRVYCVKCGVMKSVDCADPQPERTLLNKLKEQADDFGTDCANLIHINEAAMIAEEHYRQRMIKLYAEYPKQFRSMETAEVKEYMMSKLFNG